MSNKINLKIICIIIIFYSILIGTPLNNNITILNYGVIAYTFIYVLIRKIKSKNQYKIISSKIDIAILLLCVSSAIPIITGNSITNIGSYEYVLRYITIFCIYILIKAQIKEDSKSLIYIINSTIASGVIIFTFGIDNLTYNALEDVLSKLNSTLVYNQDNRFIANFAYANTTAVSMVILHILSIFQYGNLECKDKKKNIYIITAFLAVVGIVLSYSRAVWLMFALLLIIYVIFYKERHNIIKPIIITGIFAALYSVIFIALRPKEMYLLIYILLIIFVGVLILITNILSKIKIKKFSKKCYIISFIIVMIGIIIFYKYTLTQTEPLQLFESVYSENEYEQVIRNINANETYEFSFDIEAISKTDEEMVYTISVIQRNKYDDEIEITTKELSSYTGIENINVHTKEETTNVVVQFKRLNRAAGKGLTIKNLKVNQENIILKYKYLPKSLVDKIESINLSQQSVWERFVFIEDGFSILKDNFILGIGGDGYKYILPNYQQYIYGTNEVHCYPLEIWIEFGLLGIISLVCILTFTIMNIVKKIKTKEFKNLYYTIAMILGFMLIHSFTDFDMSFMYIQVLFFIFIAILDMEDKKIKENNIIESISLIIIVVLVIFNLQYSLKNNFKEYTTEEERLVSELKEEPYIERLDKIDKLLDIKNKEIDEEEIQFLTDETKKNFGIGKYEINKRLNRAKILEELKGLSEKNGMTTNVQDIQQFLIDEFKDIQEVIYQKDKTRLTDEDIENIMSEWNRILE